MKTLLAKLLLFVAATSSLSAQTIDSLASNFQNPPHSVKPRTWYHFMSGNVSREGITKDMEAIADVCIGGIIFFNGTIGIPNGPVDFNFPEHRHHRFRRHKRHLRSNPISAWRSEIPSIETFPNQSYPKSQL